MGERPRKRPHAFEDVATAPNLSLLVKARLALPSAPTPGSVSGCRVALQEPAKPDDPCGAFIATGATVYGIKVPSLANYKAIEGKEGVFLPSPGEEFEINAYDDHHKSEIQSLELMQQEGSTLLASVDAYAFANIWRLKDTWATEDDWERPAVSHLKPRDLREAGWSGISFGGTDPSRVAIARGFARDVTLYKDEKVEQCIDLVHNPAGLCFDDGSQLGEHVLLIAEGHQVSVWDVRSPKCASTLQVGKAGSSVCAVSWSKSCRPLIGAGGSERSVTIWDPRKWVSLCRWSNCVKGTIMGITFSSVRPNYCYVSGSDPEVLCGVWDRCVQPGRRRHHEENEGDVGNASKVPPSFRGDARWLGVRGGWPSCDRLVGFSSTGNLFIAQYSDSVC